MTENFIPGEMKIFSHQIKKQAGSKNSRPVWLKQIMILQNYCDEID
jgi:hypothetical protein